MFNAERSMLQMKSGEARWIGREDLHVYCWAPCDLVRMPTGRDAWQRRQPVFKLWTAGSVGSAWDASGWSDAATVAKQIATILTSAAA